MSKETETDANTKGISQQQHDDAVQAARQEGFTAGKAEGVAEGLKQGAEEAKTRISTILSHDNAKGREQLSQHLAFNTSMSADDAIATLAASEKQAEKGGSLSERMKNAPNTNLGTPPVGGTDKGENAYERGKAIAMKALGKTKVA